MLKLVLIGKQLMLKLCYRVLLERLVPCSVATFTFQLPGWCFSDRKKKSSLLQIDVAINTRACQLASSLSKKKKKKINVF